MRPREMSGFACVCQRALSLVNRKLDTPKGRQRYPLGTYTSRTGAFIGVGRANLERLLAQNGTTSGCFRSRAPFDDEVDSDL
jgi:hypothetical protein